MQNPVASLTAALLGIFVAATVVATAAHAHEYQAGAIKIVHPWMRMPPAAAKLAGGYMTLTNTGSAVDRLIGGTLTTAARVEVHEMAVAEGLMRMRQLPTGLEIKPGETVVLKPGSFHLMFMELGAAPQIDQKLKGTLVFEKAGTIEVEFKVEAAGSTGEHDGHGKSGAASGVQAVPKAGGHAHP